MYSNITFLLKYFITPELNFYYLQLKKHDLQSHIIIPLRNKTKIELLLFTNEKIRQ